MSYINLDVRGAKKDQLEVYAELFANVLRTRLQRSVYTSDPGKEAGILYCADITQFEIQHSLTEISVKFRDTLFSVSCDSDYEESPYKIYAKNGLTEIVYGEVVITYPETSFS